MNKRLLRIFDVLAVHFGPLHWWPAETPFEVVVGAVLTQNTAWTNVERAIARLKEAGVLSPGALRALERERLEELIRPAGFFRQKAQRLQLFVTHLFARHGGNLCTPAGRPAGAGRGPSCSLSRASARRRPTPSSSMPANTPPSSSMPTPGASSPVSGLLQGTEGYDQIRSLFMTCLPGEAELFNEYHALIVEECKTFCRKNKPLCSSCPLLSLCPFGQKSALS